MNLWRSHRFLDFWTFTGEGDRTNILVTFFFFGFPPSWTPAPLSGLWGRRHSETPQKHWERPQWESTAGSRQGLSPPACQEFPQILLPSWDLLNTQPQKTCLCIQYLCNFLTLFQTSADALTLATFLSLCPLLDSCNALGPWHQTLDVQSLWPLSLSMSSQVLPMGLWDLQTPALNSHQKNHFPPPGALLGTVQELLLCLEHPLQAAAGHVLV